MRPLSGLLMLLLTASSLWAKPKVPVTVRMDEGIRIDRPQDSLSRSGGASGPTTIWGIIFFHNVIVLSDNEEAVAKNNGRWCISGDIELDTAIEYHGTLDGNHLELEIPQKNGKIKKMSFEVFDHKWRKLTDLSRFFHLPPCSVESYG
jgi:hypothetical protein